MQCPRCTAPMTAQELGSHHGRPVTIDICLPCQSMWFDTFESVSLSPASTLALFRLIGEHAEATPQHHTDVVHCPRCGAAMQKTHDLQRNTRFEYVRCPARHGRLTTFYNFLREKNFIRPVTPDQLRELRAHIQSVHCSNCGAPIDLAAHASCPHCGSPLTMLDLTQAGALLAELQEAGQPSAEVDPALPLALERARRDTQATFDAFEHTDVWFRDASSAGLVGAGVLAIARWLNTRL
ncbi:MAG TPA: zf-TFIIB domain-containing protein [Vicinamibacterales bacterium]|nr:zf-TFIIB domain-containing protein [Vicinamibacterales bacterium]